MKMNLRENLRLSIFGLLLLLLALPAWAQEKLISGKVTDAQGEALIGVNVLVQGSTRGSITDLNGAFQLRVQPGDKTLLFSYLGYQDVVKEIGAQSVINVTMQDDAQQLEEVVVTALGIERSKKALGYAVQEVGGDKLSAVVQTAPLNALAGRVAGLNVSTSGSGPGGSTNIVIRGASSLTGNNQPLYVVDGVPIENRLTTSVNAGGGSDYGSAANNIDPNDIASISVLKGGAAAALYGSRGQNGVIMITTKKGAKNSKLSVALNSNFVLDRPTVLPDFQNNYAQGSNGAFSKNSIHSWGAKMDGQTVTNFLGEQQVLTPNTENPVKAFLDNGYTWTNSVALSKGGETGTYYFSLSKQDHKSVMPNSNIDRLNMNLRTTQKMTSFLNLDAKVNFINQKAFNRPNLGGSPDNPMYGLIYMPRSVQLSQMENYRTINGYPVHYTSNYTRQDNGLMTNGLPAFAANPLAQNPYWGTGLNINEDTRNRVISFMEADLSLKDLIKDLPLDKLNLKARAGMDYFVDRIHRRQVDKTLYKLGGLATIGEQRVSTGEYNGDLILTGMKTVGNFGMSMTAGTSITRRDSYSTNASSESGILNPYGEYVLNNFGNVITTDGLSQREIQSVFGMFTLDWKDQIFFEVTGRNDWSSTMNPQNRSFFYPSTSLSWVISESFELPKFIDYMKLRTSYAIVGNSLEPGQLYYAYGTNANQYFGLPYGFIPSTKPNYDMVAEMTKSTDIGLETRFLGGRLVFDVAYYKKGTENQLFRAPLPSSSGFENGWINAGHIGNEGVELSLTATPVKSGAFSWDLVANASRNWSKVDELTEGVERLVLGGLGGASIQGVFGRPVGTLHGTAFARDTQGNLLLDAAGLPTIAKNAAGANDTQRELGNTIPQWIIGFSNTITYKDFFMSVMLDAKLGHKMFSYTNLKGAELGVLGFTQDGRDDWYESEADRIALGQSSTNWTATGGLLMEGVDKDGNTVRRFVDPQKYWDRVKDITEAFVYDASYVRLQQLSIGYNLPKSLVSKTPFQKVGLSLVGNNLVYLRNKVPNVSPNMSISTNNASGVEFFAFPELASYGFNLSVEF